ncbi:MAG: exodeoxyribonuclease III [Alphaproteobacteria bacterium]|nr:exodeoxyribonuclease III [Alphaproteobacteria bacterium]
MKIASWNVNSIKARLEHAKAWLNQHSPDLLLIQELKGLEFPEEVFKDAGYNAEFVGQKAYNGVAILSKEPQKVISNALPSDESDEQARYLEVEYQNLRVINIYLPNGNPVDSDKFPYKINWMKRLYERLKELRAHEIPFLIGGDFNVIPTDKDCHDPKSWWGDALYCQETLEQWRSLLHLGLTDAFRAKNTKAEQYTFWDYQRGAWPQNKGIRIDHFLLSPPVADHLKSCTIDKEPRGQEKASDHTPIILELYN